MPAEKIGYARVSTKEQNLDRQIDALNAAGCTHMYTDKLSGKNTDRPQYQAMLDFVRDGDTVLVVELTRLSRSVKDLFELVEFLAGKGVNLVSLNDVWMDTTTPQGRLILTLMSGLSQFERELTAQRVRDGIAAAKRRGVILGRPSKTDKIKADALRLKDERMSNIEIAKELCVSLSTVERALKRG
jgi:DNA invertase Pin-like site-specific DNA recombinase